MADEEKPPMVCGIDLGTTNSAIAYVDDHGKCGPDGVLSGG